MKSERDPDFELVRACQDPDSEQFEAAFEALYVAYRDRVYSIAYRVTGNATDAMDVVQESFSLLFRKIDGFRFHSLFSTWLFRIVVNCSIDQKRYESTRRARQPRSLSTLDSGAEPVDTAAPGPIERAEVGELGIHVQKSLERLSPKLRAILALRYLEGQTYEELAQTLDISLGTVKSRLARAHVAMERVLRGTLSSHGFADGDAEEGVA